MRLCVAHMWYVAWCGCVLSSWLVLLVWLCVQLGWVGVVLLYCWFELVGLGVTLRGMGWRVWFVVVCEQCGASG